MRTTFPVTVHLLFFRGSEILLLRRYNTGYQDGNYSVPAGHLDGGETVTQAAIREGREEVGVSIAPENLRFACVLHRNEDEERVDFFMRVERWTGEPVNNEPRKCDHLCWYDLETLPVNTIPYVRQGIANAIAGISFGEFGWEG